MLYTIPWVEGPDGLSLPFALKTKYGNLVLAFTDGGVNAEELFTVLAKNLRKDFTFKLARVAADSPDELDSLLHSHLPTLKFAVVSEGTALFFEVLLEFAAGNIRITE